MDSTAEVGVQLLTGTVAWRFDLQNRNPLRSHAMQTASGPQERHHTDLRRFDETKSLDLRATTSFRQKTQNRCSAQRLLRAKAKKLEKCYISGFDLKSATFVSLVGGVQRKMNIDKRSYNSPALVPWANSTEIHDYAFGRSYCCEQNPAQIKRKESSNECIRRLPRVSIT